MTRNVEKLRTGIPGSTETHEPIATTTADGLKNVKEQVTFAWIIIAIESVTGATATVSTLATVVGQPKTPMSAGKGGFRRGLPCLPSKDSIKAVSSPQM